jgi:hypothetical protein
MPALSPGNCPFSTSRPLRLNAMNTQPTHVIARQYNAGLRRFGARPRIARGHPERWPYRGPAAFAVLDGGRRDPGGSGLGVQPVHANAAGLSPCVRPECGGAGSDVRGVRPGLDPWAVSRRPAVRRPGAPPARPRAAAARKCSRATRKQAAAAYTSGHSATSRGRSSSQRRPCFQPSMGESRRPKRQPLPGHGEPRDLPAHLQSKDAPHRRVSGRGRRSARSCALEWTRV